MFFVVLFKAIIPLKNANSIFLLFSKIRGEQLSLYTNHFTALSNRINTLKDQDLEKNFFKIFAIGPQKTFIQKKHGDNNRLRNIELNVPNNIFEWTLRFVIFSTIILFIFGVKNLFINKFQIEISNQVQFFKNNLFFDMYVPASGVLATRYLKEIQGLDNYANNITDISQTFNLLIQGMQNNSFPLHFPNSQIISKNLTDFFAAIKTKNPCDIVNNMTVYCQNHYVRNHFKNGIFYLFAFFKHTMKNCQEIFTNKKPFVNLAFSETSLFDSFNSMRLLLFP